MKAQIRHIVFNTTDPDRLAKFYVEVMGLTMLEYEEGLGYSLTDGYMNLAIHRVDVDGKPGGFNHFGFLVDDNQEVMDRIEKAGYPPAKQRPGNRHYAQYRAVDPAGNLFDLSENGYQENRPDRTAWDAAPAEKEKVR
jgi:catechol 2,3-dioxygenase-like lactoylglutathione lyase family enzyme